MKLPLSDIIVEARQRIDYGDLDSLMESISTHGLIQPIIITRENKLIAGGRRLEAHRRLGKTEIEIVYRDTLSMEELHELELEENLHRKNFSWQEHCLALANLHRLKATRHTLEGKSWGQKETGALFGVSVGKINYALKLASELADKASPLWKLDSSNEALRWLFQQKELEAMAELARRHTQVKPPSEEPPTKIESLLSPPPDEKAIARARYLSNPHNDPNGFEAYYAERQALRALPPVVPISRLLHQGDCLPFLDSHQGSFHHIVTDPPYAIDMAMLSQDNLGMANIESVEKEHDVDQNLSLFARFLPAAYRALRPQGFLVLWCDYMRWQTLYELATAAGFAVQRWPIVWVKTHTCMNSAAQYNFTKTTELAMVCRKGGAVLVKPARYGHIIASHDEYKADMDHPFVKPFAVWEYILTHISMEGESVLDPFAGHGSGVLSALRMKRNAFACEVSSDHYNYLLENVKQHYLSLNPSTQFE